MLVISLVLTRLTFSNNLLAGLPVYLTHSLRSMLNMAVWLTSPPIWPHQSLTARYSASTGCVCRSKFSSRLPSWCTKSFQHGLMLQYLRQQS